MPVTNAPPLKALFVAGQVGHKWVWTGNRYARFIRYYKGYNPDETPRSSPIRGYFWGLPGEWWTLEDWQREAWNRKAYRRKTTGWCEFVRVNYFRITHGLPIIETP